MSTDQILEQLEITKFVFVQALSISENDSLKINLKREPNSCFIKIYLSDGLQAWEGNMDIQPVFNQYKAVSVMCIQLSNTDDECSHAMNKIFKDAFETELVNYEQIKLLVYCHLTMTECSVQECVYHNLPAQWLRKIFPGKVFTK